MRSSAGAIQFGIPPETIKDAMALGLDVPTTYVVPRELFDRRRGISVAEFEFPAYYNFFLLKRRARLVVEDRVVEARIRAVFQETLFGPVQPPDAREFDEDYPSDLRPDFAKETDYFRRRADGRRITADELVEFVVFDDEAARLSPEVTIALGREGYVVKDGQEEIARLPFEVALPTRDAAVESAARPFDPPAFGITVLGASHGFDPAGKTTGFLLWLGERALLVDPPIDSTEYLGARGVAPKQIDGVILTHCHADHDAGTFQKLLQETQITLFTTPYILGSFLRKYSALSGLNEDLLRRTFHFHPVRIGAPVHLRGGELWFRYTLHSIPTIGFEAFYGGHSLFVSADTLFDPERIATMHEDGILTRARMEDLCRLSSHHSAILHEAGIPPLHTPTSALANLPADVKKQMYLVHIASKDVPRDSGLKPAKVGLEHTIAIDVGEPRFAEAMALLDVFSMVDFLRDLPLSRARALLQAANQISLPAGETIVAEGTRGDSFYIIERGTVSVNKNGRSIKRYGAGDYFGETALILEQPRSADVVAKTAVDLVVIDRSDFLAALRGTSTLRRLVNLARVRAEGAWELMEVSTVLSHLTSAQKTQLQSYMVLHEAEANELLWAAGEVPRRAYLIDDATVEIEIVGDGYNAGQPLRPFGAAAFVGDFDALRSGAAASSRAKVVHAGKLFAVEQPDLERFFDDNPGVLLSFIGARFVE